MERYNNIVKLNERENTPLTLNDKLELAFELQYSSKVRELIQEGADKQALRKCAEKIGGWRLTMLQGELLKEFDV